MMRLSLYCLAITTTALAGCATLTNDPNQPIEFVAPACKNVQVKCSAQNKRGSWTFSPPETVYIRRSDDVLNIRCSAGGQESAQSIPSRMGGKIIASAIFLDFGIVDAITDKHREYPAQIVLTACQAR